MTKNTNKNPKREFTKFSVIINSIKDGIVDFDLVAEQGGAKNINSVLRSSRCNCEIFADLINQGVYTTYFKKSRITLEELAAMWNMRIIVQDQTGKSIFLKFFKEFREFKKSSKDGKDGKTKRNG